MVAHTYDPSIEKASVGGSKLETGLQKCKTNVEYTARPSQKQTAKTLFAIVFF